VDFALRVSAACAQRKRLCSHDFNRGNLCYGFNDIFGMSPMAYIKIQRLKGVHRVLKNTDSGTTSVIQLAHQWGFWSPGHFARDYK
jgi:AraC family ethanolamine operon transcriptional activator